MIPPLRQTLWSVLAFGIVAATPVFAQAPSEAQREAIKSNCRSDYMAHCSSVPPGGAASLECLQKNMASLSGSCASAVKAVEAPAETKAEPAAAPKDAQKETQKEAPKQETKTEPAPAAAPAKAAAEPATSTKAAATAGKPSSAQIAAVRSNCRSDYPKVCAGVPTGGAAALECLEKNKAKLSAGCGKAVAAAGGGGAAPAAAGAAPTSANAAPAAAPAAEAAPLRLRPMLPREVLFVARSACGADVRALCAGVPVGGGRIVECLASQPAALSPACRDVLGQFAAR
jgi:cysteine rich repeat protein